MGHLFLPALDRSVVQPRPRVPHGLLRLLLALVVGLFVWAMAPAQANAQEQTDADTATGDGPAQGPVVGQDPIEEETEPEVREFVEGGAGAVQILETGTSAYPRLHVTIAVPPELAGQLYGDSFSLIENGRLRDLDVAKLVDPLEVVVVVDTSGSMTGGPIAAATAAATEFVSSLDADTRVAIVGFGEVARTWSGFDSTRAETAAAIDGLAAGGETSLYDAMVLASEEFSDTGARRFLVVLSDGRDTASSASLDDAATALEAANATLYAITLESPDADFADMLVLAARVDGEVVAASDTESLADTYAAIASRLTNQYRLSYNSAAVGTATIGVAIDANGIIAAATATVELEGVAAATTAATASEPEESVASLKIDTGDPIMSVVPAAASLANSPNALLIGGAGVFLGLASVLFVVMTATRSGPSAINRLDIKNAVSRGGLANIADRASGMADRLLESQERRGTLDTALETAGIEMRPGEYTVALVGGSVGLAGVGFVTYGTLAAVISFVLGLVLGRMYLSFKAGKRRKMFGAQLGGTLMMMAGSLRAGHGVVEAIDTVASRAPSPTSDEFTRAVAESRIGRDMVESLHDIAERTGSEDFVWVVRAISINRELGGDLAEILDNVGETIRDRNRLRDQVKALSAEGKVSALILFALPIVVGGWVKTSNPDYLASMTDQGAGKAMLGLAFASLILGGIWLKKLVKVEF